MAEITIRIGANEDVLAYDDGDYDSAFETAAPIKFGSPVDSNDGVRKVDLTDGTIVDGDKVDIDWNPSNYTPDATIAEADDVDDLSAHLKGIDTKLGEKVTGPGSSTDNAITRYNGASGQIVQNSSCTIDDSGSVNIPTGQSYKVNGTGVVTNQQTAEADAGAISSITLASGSDQVDMATFNTDLASLVSEINSLRSSLNSLLAKLRTHGLIAT